MKMSRTAACAVFGIDAINLTISVESLGILFRALRQRRHPDTGGTKEKFIQLTEAYEVLS